MIIIDHKELEWEEWRPGVRSRAWATAANGAQQVRIAEQMLDVGKQAPPHWHYFEENITVTAGVGRFKIDGVETELDSGHTVIIPPTAVHGFISIGDEPLHIIASMSWPINEINYVDDEDAIWRVGERVLNGKRRLVRTAKS